MLILQILFIALCLVSFPSESLSREVRCPMPSGEANGGFHLQYGPYDYTNPVHRAKKIPVVEEYHFSPEVEMLIHGINGTLGGALDYTLRAVPNHHRALESLANLSVREKTSMFTDMNFSVPCFFVRATHFAPSDGMVNAIYASYLSRIGEKELAQQEAELAVKKTPTNARVNYDVGLAYYYLGNLEKAKEYSNLAKKYGSRAVGLDILLSQSNAKVKAKSENPKQ